MGKDAFTLPFPGESGGVKIEGVEREGTLLRGSIRVGQFVSKESGELKRYAVSQNRTASYASIGGEICPLNSSQAVVKNMFRTSDGYVYSSYGLVTLTATGLNLVSIMSEGTNDGSVFRVDDTHFIIASRNANSYLGSWNRIYLYKVDGTTVSQVTLRSDGYRYGRRSCYDNGFLLNKTDDQEGSYTPYIYKVNPDQGFERVVTISSSQWAQWNNNFQGFVAQEKNGTSKFAIIASNDVYVYEGSWVKTTHSKGIVSVVNLHNGYARCVTSSGECFLYDIETGVFSALESVADRYSGQGSVWDNENIYLADSAQGSVLMCVGINRETGSVTKYSLAELWSDTQGYTSETRGPFIQYGMIVWAFDFYKNGNYYYQDIDCAVSGLIPPNGLYVGVALSEGAEGDTIKYIG